MQERTCPVCGKSFKPTHHNQVYCPPTKRAGKGQARSRCARAAMNRSYRSTTEMAVCQHCDGEFQRVRGRSQHVYCSELCHFTAKAERYGEGWKASVAWPPYISTHDTARFMRAMRCDPCVFCGGEADVLDHIVARHDGGEDDWTNRAAICSCCNNSKWRLPLLFFLGHAAAKRQWESWDVANRDLRSMAARPPAG